MDSHGPLLYLPCLLGCFAETDLLLAPFPFLEHFPLGFIHLGFLVAPSAASMAWVLFAVQDLAFGRFWAFVRCVFLYLLHGMFVSASALLDIVFSPLGGNPLYGLLYWTFLCHIFCPVAYYLYCTMY